MRGLVNEVRRVRDEVGDARLNELGLEYKIVGEFLRKERDEKSLLPALSAKLWQYARRQKAWLRKIHDELISSATEPHPDRS
jgi:tRNA A37 N6-isopentenylltransferase MiaA